MATLASDLVQQTKDRYLNAGAVEPRNKLAANYTAGSGSLSFAYDLKGIQAGATLSVGLNVFYVWAVDSTGKTATVDGGQNGSVDANATSGAVVLVNPRWTDFHIFTAINEDLVDLSAPAVGLYQIKTVPLVYNAAAVGYDLTGVTDITQILEIRFDEPDQYKRTPRLETGDYRLERNNATTDYASTFSLKLLRGGSPGRNVNVLYKAPFTALATLTSNATTTGLGVTAYDLPPMGAAMRLLVGREIRRNDITSQGDTRRSEEVTAGSVGASWRGLAAMRQQRINAEVSRLETAYPTRTF